MPARKMRELTNVQLITPSPRKWKHLYLVRDCVWDVSYPWYLGTLAQSCLMLVSHFRGVHKTIPCKQTLRLLACSSLSESLCWCVFYTSVQNDSMEFKDVSSPLWKLFALKLIIQLIAPVSLVSALYHGVSRGLWSGCIFICYDCASR